MGELLARNEIFLFAVNFLQHLQVQELRTRIDQTYNKVRIREAEKKVPPIVARPLRPFPLPLELSDHRP